MERTRRPCKGEGSNPRGGIPSISLDERIRCCNLYYCISMLETLTLGTNEVHGCRALLMCRQSLSSLLSKLRTSIRDKAVDILVFDRDPSRLYPSSAIRSLGMNDAILINSSHEVRVPFSWSSESRAKGDARSWDGGGSSRLRLSIWTLRQYIKSGRHKTNFSASRSSCGSSAVMFATTSQLDKSVADRSKPRTSESCQSSDNLR